MTPEIKAIIAILLGILFCFCGYKVQKLLITIVWFIIGYEITSIIGPNFITNHDTLFIIKIIVGFILASVGFKLEKLALFVTVSYLTFITISPYVTGFSKEVTLIIEGVASLLVGGLSVLFIKPILITATSIAGASIIKESIPAIVSLEPKIIFLVCVIIAISGLVIQFKSN